MQYIRHSQNEFYERPSSPLRAGFETRVNIQLNSNQDFATYQLLQDTSATIAAKRLDKKFDPSAETPILNELLSFHQSFLATPINASDPFDLRILWHLALMNLFADFDLLERAVGRDGPPGEHLVVQTQTWSTSSEAVRCAMHGALIVQALGNFPLKQEPALHTPRAIFFAGIVWYCYATFAPPGIGVTVDNLMSTKFSDLEQLGVDAPSLLFETQGFKHARPSDPETNVILCTAADILRRLGHFEISRKYSTILSELIHNGV